MKDNLLQQAKIEAAKKHVSLTAFIEEAVEQKLYSINSYSEEVKDFEIITFKGNGVYQGINLNDSSGLIDKMEG